jgi:hypothetical protein
LFLNFFLQWFFMGIIMTLYVVAFFCFSHRVSGVFTQAFVIYIFRFFLLGFSKIVFILCDVQMLNGEGYNINVKWPLVLLGPATAMPTRHLKGPPAKPSRSYVVPLRLAVTHVYKGMNERESSCSTLNLIPRILLIT